MFGSFMLRIRAIGKFTLVSPFISFVASAIRLPKRNEQGRLCGKEKGTASAVRFCQSFHAQSSHAPRWQKISNSQGLVY
jgi:hypothetical protein